MTAPQTHRARLGDAVRNGIDWSTLGVGPNPRQPGPDWLPPSAKHRLTRMLANGDERLAEELYEAERRVHLDRENRRYEEALRASTSITPSATDPSLYLRHTVSDLLSSDLTFEWDAVGLLVRPTYGVDAGELKTLKSYFGDCRAQALAGGVPVLGRWPVPERRRVLQYVAEGGRIPYTRRAIRIADAYGHELNSLDGWLETIFQAGPLDSVGFRDGLRAALRDFQPHVVHLDPLYPFQPMTVSASQLAQVGAMLNEVQAICAEHDATFWLTSHMNQTGTGFDLKRITGAGVSEWADSWCLLKHRETPDVDGGRFRLAVDVGSRQWGGATHHVDFDIGHFDPDTGTHDGPIRWKVTRPATSGLTASDQKRQAAARAILAAAKRARTAKTKTELATMACGDGVGKAVVDAELVHLIDVGMLVQSGTRAAANHHEYPLYRLASEWSKSKDGQAPNEVPRSVSGQGQIIPLRGGDDAVEKDLLDEPF